MKGFRFFSNSVICLVALALSAGALAGQTIDYFGEEVVLGPYSLYVDGSLSDGEAASPYVFNDFNEAMSALRDGTPEQPMRVYIAPWVYWVDDPDDPEPRRPTDVSTPIGLTVRCESLQLLGMSADPRDVVLASARGQTQGAEGNFTMFDFYGNDLVVRNLTMGNYCNIDLEYPLNPALNRPKRNSAITQAQLAFCHGDRVLAENVRFVSRLNLTPLSGARRLLFVNCHFECTDDSLAHSGVYLGCDFDFWGRQPFGSVDPCGSVFMDCDFNILHGLDIQAISKSVGRHSLVDCRFHAGGQPVSLEWTFRPEAWLRCYQYGISLDGRPAFIGASKPYNTVSLDRNAQLGAYRLTDDDGSVIYNTYNLLCGEDGWDPQGIRETVERLGERDKRDYSALPTCMELGVRYDTLRTGGNSATYSAALFRHAGFRLDNQKVSWKVQPGFEHFVSLSDSTGPECTVTARNDEDRTVSFDLMAISEGGLEAALTLTVMPDFVPAPEFTELPAMEISAGEARVNYLLDLQGRKDESLVTWYRCDDRKGSRAVPVSVSRGGPKTSYRLSRADVGHYLAVGVRPKHLRCEAGEEVFFVSRRPVSLSQLADSLRNAPVLVYETDFSDFPCENRTELRPGFWTVDAFKPEDTREYDWTPDLNQPCWTWGTGINGAKGTGLQQLQQGARLRYTAVEGSYSGMSVTWQVDPAKDGGQGFASARQQYLDLFINFDNESLSGYALRVIRTTKYANAVDVLLVRYDNGKVTPLTEGVTVDCFLTGCVLDLSVQGNVLKASVSGPGRVPELADDPAVHHSAELSAEVEVLPHWDLGLQHTSTVGTESRIMLHSLKAEWTRR